MMEAMDTPALVVDAAVAEGNIERMATAAKAHGVALRPHTKTHKSSYFAEVQQRYGINGVMVAKLGEAEVMRQAGFREQSIGYPLVGEIKARRLRDLVLGGTNVRVSVDSPEGLEFLVRVYQETGISLDALVELDTGMRRCGIREVGAIIELAEAIQHSEGVRYRGITCFGGHISQTYDKDVIVARIREEDQFLATIAKALSQQGLTPDILSEGGTIPAAFLEELHTATEIRPGTYIFNDAATVAAFSAQWADCAAFVVATVVSTPAATRAIVDAGSKALGLDGPVDGSYGHLLDHEGLRLVRLSEEHGIIQRDGEKATGLRIGDTVRIIPNHICPTVNLYDYALLIRDGAMVGEVRIDARGMVR